MIRAATNAGTLRSALDVPATREVPLRKSHDAPETAALSNMCVINAALTRAWQLFNDVVLVLKYSEI